MTNNIGETLLEPVKRVTIFADRDTPRADRDWSVSLGEENRWAPIILRNRVWGKKIQKTNKKNSAHIAQLEI